MYDQQIKIATRQAMFFKMLYRLAIGVFLLFIGAIFNSPILSTANQIINFINSIIK